MRQPDFAGAARALQAYQSYRSRLSRMSIEAREADVQPVLSDDETAGHDRRTTSPSVPVESREQPSGWVCDEPNHLPIGWFRDRIEEQTQLAIRFNLDRGFGAVERDRLTAERDGARDLAAHLEEDSARLREQLEAVRAALVAAERTDGEITDLYWSIRYILSKDEPGHAQ